MLKIKVKKDADKPVLAFFNTIFRKVNMECETYMKRFTGVGDSPVLFLAKISV